jgi:hypothetical protein
LSVGFSFLSLWHLTSIAGARLDIRLARIGRLPSNSNGTTRLHS